MYTHWLPDQPTAPTCVPTEGENLKAPVVGLTDGENLDLAGISVYGKPTHSAQEAARKAADEILLYMGCSPRDQLAISAIILRHFQAVPAQSPGSGEALRAVLEKVASGSQLRLDFPRYRLPESLCDEIRKALAQPATPPLTSGERDYLAEIATLAETTLKHLEPSCSAAVEIRNALSRLELMRSAHPPSVKIGDGTDSQRLDWLEAHGHGVMSGRNSSDNRWQVSENNGKGGSLIGGHNGDRGTIRAAIDAAMQADAGREEK